MEHYTVVSNTSKVYFEKEINELIKKGYEPLGGLCMSGSVYDTVYHQAMIKKDKDTI